MILVGVLGGTSVSAQEKSTSESIRTATIQLFKAVENHDVEAAQAALDNGADVNGIAEGHPAGGDFNEVDDTGPVTPLILALHQSQKGQETVDPLVKLLVGRRADLNFYPGRIPPVVYAREHSAHLFYLLEQGANPNARYTTIVENGQTESTLLHSAAACCGEIVQILLRHGANPEVVETGRKGAISRNSTPLVPAIANNHLEIARLLFQYGHPPWGGVLEEFLAVQSRQSSYSFTSFLALVDREVPADERQPWIDLVERVRQRDLNFKAPTVPLLVTHLNASATLKDDADPYRYSPANAFDGSPKTAWVEGVEGPGVGGTGYNHRKMFGESVKVAFNKPVVFDAVEVMPGYFKGRYWKLNNRVREMVLWGNRGERGALDGKREFIESIKFKDRREAQRHKLEHMTEADTLTFTLRAAYEGERWDDTPISEIALYRNGERIELEGNLADADSPVRLSKDEW